MGVESMKRLVNGKYVEITAEEIAMIHEESQKYMRELPQQSYGELVDAEIRKKYTVSQEFAILRQKDEKPDEYAEYYEYCEQCKLMVKEVLV